MVEDGSGDRSKDSGHRALLVVGIGLVLSVAGGVGVLSYISSFFEKAERNLPATRFAFALVEQFVKDKGRWPCSWNELEEFRSTLSDIPWNGKTRDANGNRWPSDLSDIEKEVAIDFHADLKDLVDQEPGKFSSIKPIGPCYKHDDFILSLLKTVKTRAISKGR